MVKGLFSGNPVTKRVLIQYLILFFNWRFQNRSKNVDVFLAFFSSHLHLWEILTWNLAKHFQQDPTENIQTNLFHREYIKIWGFLKKI